MVLAHWPEIPNIAFKPSSYQLLLLSVAFAGSPHGQNMNVVPTVCLSAKLEVTMMIHYQSHDIFSAQLGRFARALLFLHPLVPVFFDNCCCFK